MQFLWINGTSSEIAGVLEKFPELRNQANTNGSPHPAAASVPPIVSLTTPSYWTEKALKEVMDELWGNEKKLLGFVFNEGAVGFSDVMKHMGFKKGQQLSGVLSGITRQSKKATGFKKAKLIKWRRVNENDWDGEYYVEADAAQLLNNLAIKL